MAAAAADDDMLRAGQDGSGTGAPAVGGEPAAQPEVVGEASSVAPIATPEA
jgi:hypothetical protein